MLIGSLERESGGRQKLRRRRVRTRWGVIKNVGEERNGGESRRAMREWKGKIGWSKGGWGSYDYYAPCCFAWLLFPIAWSDQGSDLGCQPKGGYQHSFESSCLLPSNQTSHTLLLSTSSVCATLWSVGYVMLSCSFKFPSAGYGSGINCRFVQGPTKPVELISIWASQTTLTGHTHYENYYKTVFKKAFKHYYHL